MADRTLRVGVAQGDEAIARSIQRQTCLAWVKSGHRVQQRSIEELLVNTPDLARMSTPLGHQILDRVAAVTHRSPKATQLDGVVRHGVRPPEAMQLDAMLKGPKEPIGLRHG